MKKTLLTILGAILVGFGLGLFFFKKFDTNIEALATSVKSIYAVQVGVYKNIDNAKDVANKMKGIVVLDNDYYRVYIDIIKDKEILNSREEYYKNNNSCHAPAPHQSCHKSLSLACSSQGSSIPFLKIRPV